MSSTRLPRESRADFYRTPKAAVTAIASVLIERIPVGASVLDAGAGDGAIALALAEVLRERRVEISGCEIDVARAFEASALGTPGNDEVSEWAALRPGWCWAGDFLQAEKCAWDAIVMNPPFSQAREFIEHAIQLVEPKHGIVVALLRLGWLAGVGRAEFHRAHPSDLYVLARRPSFNGGKGTDSADYAWFVWDTHPSARGRVGTVTIVGGDS